MPEKLFITFPVIIAKVSVLSPIPSNGLIPALCLLLVVLYCFLATWTRRTRLSRCHCSAPTGPTAAREQTDVGAAVCQATCAARCAKPEAERQLYCCTGKIRQVTRLRRYYCRLSNIIYKIRSRAERSLSNQVMQIWNNTKAMRVAGSGSARIEQLTWYVVVFVRVRREARLGRLQVWTRVAHNCSIVRVRAASRTRARQLLHKNLKDLFVNYCLLGNPSGRVQYNQQKMKD